MKKVFIILLFSIIFLISCKNNKEDFTQLSSNGETTKSVDYATFCGRKNLSYKCAVMGLEQICKKNSICYLIPNYSNLNYIYQEKYDITILCSKSRFYQEGFSCFSVLKEGNNNIVCTYDGLIVIYDDNYQEKCSFKIKYYLGCVFEDYSNDIIYEKNSNNSGLINYCYSSNNKKFLELSFYNCKDKDFINEILTYTKNNLVLIGKEA